MTHPTNEAAERLRGHFHRQWNEFLVAERGWAKTGSGMTKEQITGAAMMLSWIEQQERAALAAERDQMREQVVASERKRIADEVRALKAMHVINTDYVPQAKRRPDAVVDRASILQIVNETPGRLTDPARLDSVEKP